VVAFLFFDQLGWNGLRFENVRGSLRWSLWRGRVLIFWFSHSAIIWYLLDFELFTQSLLWQLNTAIIRHHTNIAAPASDTPKPYYRRLSVLGLIFNVSYGPILLATSERPGLVVFKLVGGIDLWDIGGIVVTADFMALATDEGNKYNCLKAQDESRPCKQTTAWVIDLRQFMPQ